MRRNRSFPNPAIPLAMLLLAALCLPLPAQVRNGTPQQPQEPASVSGRAVDIASGEPLSKVEVRLFAGRQGGAGGSNVFAARTDATGTFQLNGIAPGNYFLMISRRGYASSNPSISGLRTTRRQGGGSMVAIQPGERLSGVEIRLQPSSVITGQVLDEEGEPMTGVLIQAEQYRYVQGKKTLAATGRDTTDDRGIYRIYDLAAGRYLVKAQGRSLLGRAMGAMRGGGPMGGPGMGGRMSMLNPAEDPMSYAETYYPNAFSPDQAIPLQLTPGSELGGIDFVLRPSPSYSISGIVSPLPSLEEGGAVLVSARKGQDSPAFGNAAGVAQVNPRTGEFVLRNLTPGSYEVIARTGGRRQGAAGSGKTLVEVTNRSVDGVAIALQPNVSVSGMVAVPENAPTENLARMAIRASSGGFGPGRGPTRVDADGRFTLDVSPADVNASSFALENVPAGFYVKSMKLGGMDLLAAAPEQQLNLGGNLEIQLATDGASLSGFARTTDGQPIPQARVTLLPEKNSSGAAVWRKTTVAGDDGSFQFADIAPGRYRLYSFEELDADPSLDPDFLSNFSQSGKPVELKAAASATLNPPVIPASETALYLGEVAQ